MKGIQGGRRLLNVRVRVIIERASYLLILFSWDSDEGSFVHPFFYLRQKPRMNELLYTEDMLKGKERIFIQYPIS